MDFSLPPEVLSYLTELDAFIEREIVREHLAHRGLGLHNDLVFARTSGKPGEALGITSKGRRPA